MNRNNPTVDIVEGGRLISQAKELLVFRGDGKHLEDFNQGRGAV